MDELAGERARLEASTQDAADAGGNASFIGLNRATGGGRSGLRSSGELLPS